jgi:hypothetical protein
MRDDGLCERRKQRIFDSRTPLGCGGAVPRTIFGMPTRPQTEGVRLLKKLRRLYHSHHVGAGSRTAI